MRTLPKLPGWVQMEHQVAQILPQQQIHGWSFNESEARSLESTLRKELEDTTRILREQHPFVAGAMFTPKRDNRTQGYVNGAELQRLKELNPTSRDHISWILQTHYGWTPISITSTGKAVIDEVVLKDIGTDIALQFLRLLDLTKQLGMISEGVNAWQKLSTKSRIHHHCSVSTNTHGARTTWMVLWWTSCTGTWINSQKRVWRNYYIIMPQASLRRRSPTHQIKRL